MSTETQTDQKPKARAAIVPVTPFEQNCTLIWCETTQRGVVIDPGGDLDRIEAAIKETGITIERIWLTHGHLDHAGGADELREKLGVPIEGPHLDDKQLLKVASASASPASAMFALTAGSMTAIRSRSAN